MSISPACTCTHVVLFVGTMNNVVVGGREEERQDRMTSDVVDAEPVAGRASLVVDVQERGELRAIGKGDAPKVERAVSVLGNHLDNWCRFVFVGNTGCFTSG